MEYDFTKEFAFSLITGVSRTPETVIEKIKEEIEKAKKDGLNEEDFERSKKTLYGEYIADYNSVEETARLFLGDYFKGINSFEYLDKYNSVTKEYAEEILKKVFVEEKRVTSIVK